MTTGTHAPEAHGAQRAQSTRWRLDPTRSAVVFRAKNLWGLASVKGSFSRYHGALDVSAPASIELTVEADSLDTRNRRRDGHLRSPAFFSVDAHPYIAFVSHRVIVDGEHVSVRGHLDVRGATVFLNLDAKVRRVGDELEVEAVTEADHRELGMTWNFLGMIRAPTQLIVRGRLVRDD